MTSTRDKANEEMSLLLADAQDMIEALKSDPVDWDFVEELADAAAGAARKIRGIAEDEVKKAALLEGVS